MICKSLLPLKQAVRLLSAICLIGTSRAGALPPPNRPGNFDADWHFLRGDVPGAEAPAFDDADWRVLDVPHDWSIDDLPPHPPAVDKSGNLSAVPYVGPFSPDAPGGPSTGHVLGGTGWYRKHFTLGAANEGRLVSILFDGVYMDSDVWLNGRHLGNHPYGYTPFAYDLTPYLNPTGQENVLAVRVRNAGRNSRWYSGSGIFRHVTLTTAAPLHVPLWGVAITTPQISPQSATVSVVTTVTNGRAADCDFTLQVRLHGPTGRVVQTGEVAEHLAANSQTDVPMNLEIKYPTLWSPETPNLYRAEVTVLVDGQPVDYTESEFGVRTLHFSVADGFTLNGQPVKLRGACVHHDNGPLGSAAIDRAEERRVELLKSQGFNAIRTSHNPPSPAFMAACDRLGMLVLDEAFDCWEKGKNPDDYGKYFNDWWQRDLDAMILRDRNHPCVILWSIGNEIPDKVEASGYAAAKELADEVHRLDPTRPVTEAVNQLEGGKRPWSDTAPVFTFLDVGGYNYRPEQYASDHQKFPQRLIVGTESFPLAIYDCWTLVENNPYVIGDFVWTGMDYLGESGIGRAGLEPIRGLGQWPWFDANCGDLDICGFKKPQSFFRDVVWRRRPLELAVHSPLPPGQTEHVSQWGWPDESPSWTWPGSEGQPLQVAVYSRCDAVRLELNGRVVGVQTLAPTNNLAARFEVLYAPGELQAVGLVKGKVVARQTLRTTGEAKKIRLVADRRNIRASRADLAYVTVEITDKHGQVVPNAEVPITFSISGAGELAAVGSGSANRPESFHGRSHTTDHGRALAILRPVGPAGAIHLRAESPGLSPAELTVKTAN